MFSYEESNWSRASRVMGKKYNTVLGSLLLAGAALAAPCPPAITAIAGQVAKLRDVPAPFSPPCRLIAPGALRAALDRKLRRDLPVAPELFIEALAGLGFIEGEPGTVYSRLLDFYASQVLGYYEPDGDEMVVVNTPAAARAEGDLVWAHELEHAAQEHRFHLPSRLLAMRGDSDEQRAASAIAEGEAMLVMFVLNTPGVAPEALALAETAVRQQARELAPPGVPRYFVADLAFPYTAGFAAVLRAYRTGGWTAVDRLLAHPPASTAALLHPDRPGVPGTVPAGALPPVPEGWQEVFTDSVGEWGLAFLLGRRLGTPEADALAAGWDGDRLRLVRDRARPDRWAVAWRLACRTVQARQSLEEAMQRNLPALFAHLAPPGQLEFTWVGAGRTLEVLAAWPPPSPRQRSPS